MAHRNDGFNVNTGKPRMDAVGAWNTDLKQYGERSPEGRSFMKDSDNYELEWGHDNMSKGGKLNMTYDDPYTPLRNPEDVYPDREDLKKKKHNTSDDGKCNNSNNPSS